MKPTVKPQNYDRTFQSVQGSLSQKQMEILRAMAKMHDLPMSRLIAIAIDNELQKDKPFKINLTIPDIEIIENSYAHEAQLIIKFIKSSKLGLSIDMLYTLRHDIGIDNAEILLLALKECLNHKLLEAVKAPESVTYKLGTIVYRVKTDTPQARKKIRTEIEDYEKIQKLMKKLKITKDDL